MRVLVLSAYHADSHRCWLDGLMNHLPSIEWTVLSLPARYFSWRIRGNSLTWAMQQSALLSEPYDVILATSMTDLSALRGLVPALSRIPTVVYFHENQFSYPKNIQQRDGVEPQILNLYTALAADKVLFNSEYNRSTLLRGVDTLLARLPDFSPRAEVAARLADSAVLPVGLDIKPCLERPAGERLSVLWNHRWEYDKGPDRLLALVKECNQQALPIDFYIAGQQFRNCPTEFKQIEVLILASDCLALRQWGYVVDSLDYSAMLASCDVVLSTAIHDFQGLSVLQAVAMGCVPLVPDRLCYPEWFGGAYRYRSDDTLALEAIACREALQRLLAQKQRGRLPLLDVSALSWQTLAPQYLDVFEGLLN
ncbi:tRNA-queuosine alpha-mannosyltransferase domain-containing protein [Zhongshania arctica]|uniref:tRNA-queuosine alpha-mannosyltransferase n=1 Tax=Zhongshania arctica TaxID=3238302 RepID=A0ABV3TX45_9GAMM